MRAVMFCLLAALPLLSSAEGLEPLDNKALSESRVTTGLSETERELEELDQTEERQRLLPEGDVPAARPGLQLPPAEPGLSPAQQQFVESFRNAVGDINR